MSGPARTVNDRFYLPKARGGGVLRREVWVDERGRVIRYNLAYINPLIYAGDNGRVLGFDSAQGIHHRHYMGKVEAVSFDNFEAIARRFEREWNKLVKEVSDEKD